MEENLHHISGVSNRTLPEAQRTSDYLGPITIHEPLFPNVGEWRVLSENRQTSALWHRHQQMQMRHTQTSLIFNQYFSSHYKPRHTQINAQKCAAILHKNEFKKRR